MELAGKKELRFFPGKQMDVGFEEGDVSFQLDNAGAVQGGYRPKELERLPYSHPCFIIMRYSDPRLMKQVIGSADFPKAVLIDCDGADLGLEHIADLSILLNCP